MYHLAALFPPVKRVRIALSRDQFMLLMLASNELLLGLETYIAHLISGTIVPYEWIPIIFGPSAALLILTALANLVFLLSITVGLVGAYFHVVRAIRPYALPGEQISVPLLVWAPPILGPLTFALVGLLGISAAWIEDPPDSGTLVISKKFRLRLPYSKTRAYFYMVSMGSLATVISSVLDHARTDFSNPWLWVPTSIGVFATVVAVALAALDSPSKGDLATYFTAMLLMLLVGAVGAWLHVSQNLTTTGTFVGERFIRGAPPLAPLLFSDMGAIGLLVLLDPAEK